MRVAVAFQNERLDLEVAPERLIARWEGPPGSGMSESTSLVLDALEHPRDFPPLRQAVVSGDRVAIALDAEVPHPRPVLDAIAQVLERAGVDPGSTTVVATRGGHADLALSLPTGMTLVPHDPDDRKELAYLAATAEGQRIYLNRHLTDADFVLPVGPLGDDPVLGSRGPWGVIYPGLSDRETLRSFRARSSDEGPDGANPPAILTESSEVSWLLGCQLQLGLLPGVSGLAGAIAGTDTAVREQGGREFERLWSFRPEDRAAVVVVGIGQPGVGTRIEDLASGLATAARLVQRGGKIVALSRAEGAIGPALRRLIEAGDPRSGPAALRGHEADPDFIAARQLARALAWADVYLLSKLEPDDVENLAMVPLDRPEEARRLVALSDSCLIVSQAELTRARVPSEEEDRP